MSYKVSKILISRALTGFICWYGIEKVFERSIGISIFGISLLAVTYIATSALLNIPTGILADKYGRKYAIILACVALLLCTIIGGIAQNIYEYAVAVILWGLFYTTQNGAYEATLYDTLKEEKNENEYARYAGLSTAYFWGAIFVSSILGAWVGSKYGLRKAYLITIIPNVINIIIAFSLYEPAILKHDNSRSSLSMMKQGFNFLKSSQKLLLLSAVFLVIEVFGWMTNEFSQLFFLELGFSIFIIGILNATSGLFQSVGNFIGHKFTKLSGKLIVAITILLYFVTFALPTHFRNLSITLFLVFVLIRNAFYISNDSKLQHLLPSQIRATTVSSLGMVNDGLLIFCYLSFGIVSQKNNVKNGYLLIGFYMILLVIVVKLVANSKKFNASVLASDKELIVSSEIDSMPR
jgi:MFS family permease